MSSSTGDGSAPPPVIRPEQFLRAGRSDARNLLIVWYVRKLFYPLLLLGLIGAFATGSDDTEVTWSDPDEVVGDLLSPLAGLVLAVVVRIVANLASLVLAFPLARDRDATLAPRTGVTRGLTRWLELRQVTRACRAFRWTHHVRQEALRRVAPESTIKWKLDQIFDIATIVLVVMTVITLVVVASA